jgi:hypothetical protein
MNHFIAITFSFFTLMANATTLQNLEINEQMKLEINGCEKDEFGTIQLMNINTLQGVCKPIICFSEKVSGQMDGVFQAKVYLGIKDSNVRKYHSEIKFISLKNSFQDNINYEIELKKFIQDGVCREAHYEEELKGANTRTVVLK